MRTIMATALLWVICVAPAPAQDNGNAAAGKKIAAKHCTRCHVVADINPGGGISSTPSFQMLVRRRPDYRERFQTFFARRPHPAFLWLESAGRIRPDLPPNAKPVTLTEQNVADMLAYVETLKAKTEDEKRKAKKPLVLKPRPMPRVR